MPGPIFEMVESTRRRGAKRSFVRERFTFPGQEFRQDKRDCYLFRVPRSMHTYGYPIFSSFSTGSRQTFPRQIRFGAFLTGTGARCRVFREQTFAKPVKLASHFKSGPARGGTIDPN